MYKITKKKIGISSIIILLVLMILLVNVFDFDFYLFRWLENGIYNLLAFFISTVESLASSVENIYSSFFRSRELIQENYRLRQELSELMIYNISLKEIEEENQRLRELTNLEEDLLANPTVVGARRVGLAPASWEKSLLVSAGSNDDVSERMPVVSYGGNLLGVVINAGVSSSQVKLVTDPEFVAGARVAREDSRALGIIRGQPGSSNLLLERIAWDADIEPGDEIVTSGISGDFPRGLPIGVVISVEPASYGLSQTAEVSFNLESRTIEEVLIITDF